MTRQIERLLDIAAEQSASLGAVDLCTQTALAGEGYLLSALDLDVETLAERNSHFI